LFQGAHRELSGATDIYGAKQGYIGFHEGVAGFVTFENPLLAAALLTLLLGFALVASGIMRIILAFSMKEGTPRIWVILSSIITLVLGLVIPSVSISSWRELAGSASGRA
jgi:uncharacterized membrane protein HdeD (DUF308 family)